MSPRPSKYHVVTAGWLWIDYAEFIDISPVNDNYIHELGDECWCKPTVRRTQEDASDQEFVVIIHNAYDGRE